LEKNKGNYIWEWGFFKVRGQYDAGAILLDLQVNLQAPKKAHFAV